MQPSRGVYAFFVILATLLFAGCQMRGCGSPPPQPSDRKAQKTAVVGIVGTPERFNPLLDTSDAARQVEYLFYRPLALWTDKWTIKPQWAGVPQVEYTPGRFTFGFELRPDARWSDGQSMSYNDYMLAYEMAVLLPPEDLPIWTRGFNIDTRGSSIIRLHYARLPGTPVELMPLPAGLLRPQLEKNPNAFFEGEIFKKPPSCGPFVGQTWSSQQLELGVNPMFTPKRPALEKIVMRLYSTAEERLQGIQRGELDVVADPTPAERDALTSGPMKVHSAMSPTLWVVSFNTTHPLLKDVKLRKALATALDRAAIAKGVGDRPLAQSWLHPRHTAFVPSFEEYTGNAEKATKLLEAAGFSKRKDGGRGWVNSQGVPLLLSLVSIGGGSGDAALDSIAQAWKAIGVDVITDRLTPAEYLGRLASNRSPAIMIHALDVGPTVQPAPLFSKRSIPVAKGMRGDNLANWTDSKNELLCRNFVKQPNAVLKQHQKLVSAQLPLIPLFYDLQYAAWVDGLQGVTPRGFGPLTWNAEDWTWK